MKREVNLLKSPVAFQIVKATPEKLQTIAEDPEFLDLVTNCGEVSKLNVSVYSCSLRKQQPSIKTMF